jgi:MFS transporter, OFA family, oxalate/formate antiporter
MSSRTFAHDRAPDGRAVRHDARDGAVPRGGGAALKPARRGATALLAATIVDLPFGTIYAFSVFLKPMEALLGATRAEMTFVFGLATVALTAGMNVAPRLYHRFAPAPLAIVCGLASAAGLWLAASATSFTAFLIGYGVLFGPGAGAKRW